MANASSSSYPYFFHKPIQGLVVQFGDEPERFGPLQHPLADVVGNLFCHSVEDMGQALVRTYEFYGLGTANRTRLNVSLREGSLASFAYILHLEFPEPGMYCFERLFDGPPHKWLLWDQQRMERQLYRLREAGLLAKVSEIDRLRQLTTEIPEENRGQSGPAARLPTDEDQD